jgi:hypothetical protein
VIALSATVAKHGDIHLRRVRKLGEKRVLASSCLSVRMEKLGFCGTYFREFFCLF